MPKTEYKDLHKPKPSLLERMKAINFQGFRYHTIPPLVLLIFFAMMALCYVHSPEQYRESKVFHISNLGNWQEGLSFFSSGMITIGVLLYALTGELLEQRMAEECLQSSCIRRFGWIYKAGSVLLLIGLVVTGCFQQSHNKPAHTTGVIILGVGFTIMFWYDMFYYLQFHCKRENGRRWKHVWFGFQILIALFAVASGFGFLYTHYTSQHKWKSGKDAALADLDMTTCPGRSEDDRLKGTPYPNYYPCKSKTLWLSDDPGWESYKQSAFCEIAMFVALGLYPFTYWGFLKVKKKKPYWFPQAHTCESSGKSEPTSAADDGAQGEPAQERLIADGSV